MKHAGTFLHPFQLVCNMLRLVQVTELECRLQSSSSQLSSALEAGTQHLERYREAKAEAAGLVQQLEQVRQGSCCS